jgi:hypothetical protein
MWFKKRTLKELIREVLREEIKNIPLIISERAPTADDVYLRGTMWLHGNDKYMVKSTSAEWEKQ